MTIIKWIHSDTCNECMKEVNIKPKNNLGKLQYIVEKRESSLRCNGCGVLAQTKEVIKRESCRTD